MEPNIENKQGVSRKQFIQICGTVIAGGSILGVSSLLLHKNGVFSAGTADKEKALPMQKEVFKSPYKLVSSFSTPDPINGFELHQDKLLVATPNKVAIYDQSGTLLHQFAIADTLRDIAIADNLVYLLFPARIEVYKPNGEAVRQWEACSEESDYCSLAVSPEAVFVTDAAGKNICKYTTEGSFVTFIQSPNKFIVPGYSFGITYLDGTIYCSNPGRHLVEKYTPEGKYISSFGKAGGGTGMFCGCCNPVHLSKTATGEIITSEKGNPRISCYSNNGEFRSVLLDSNALGGGNMAYEVKVYEDKLVVSGTNLISLFQYDSMLAAKTACTTCKVECPLRKGVTI